MRGAGSGTLTVGGQARPGHRVEFRFVDDARGNARDRSALRIESPRGKAVFSASGLPGAPTGGGTAASCSRGGSCRAVCRASNCAIEQRGAGTGYNRARRASNAPPTGIALSPQSVLENRPAGTPVGKVSTADRDRGDTHTYRLVSGPGADDNGSFGIDGSTLKTRAAFDFERKASSSVRVRTSDARGARFEKVFRITVDDVGENAAPVNISLSNSAVDENKPVGTEVGALSTTDPDSGDTHTYSLVSGSGDGDNASFRITGSKLETTPPSTSSRSRPTRSASRPRTPAAGSSRRT